MQMVLERQEADHAMSWLSTLGGAFSALGEEFEYCVRYSKSLFSRFLHILINLCITHTG